MSCCGQIFIKKSILICRLWLTTYEPFFPVTFLFKVLIKGFSCRKHFSCQFGYAGFCNKLIWFPFLTFVWLGEQTFALKFKRDEVCHRSWLPHGPLVLSERWFRECQESGTTVIREEKKLLQTYTPVRAYLTERAIAFGGYVLEKSNSGSLILFLGQVIKRAMRWTAINKVLLS